MAPGTALSFFCCGCDIRNALTMWIREMPDGIEPSAGRQHGPWSAGAKAQICPGVSAAAALAAALAQRRDRVDALVRQQVPVDAARARIEARCRDHLVRRDQEVDRKVVGSIAMRSSTTWSGCTVVRIGVDSRTLPSSRSSPYSRSDCPLPPPRRAPCRDTATEPTARGRPAASRAAPRRGRTRAPRDARRAPRVGARAEPGRSR